MLLSGVTIAFDLDGTLVDTAPDLVGALNIVLAGQGLAPLSLVSARRLIGGGMRRMLERGFSEDGARLSAEEAPKLVERFIELYRDRIARESRPFDGVPAALEELLAEGARLVVCTNKQTDLSLDLLAKVDLLDFFTAVAGRDVVSCRKPDPAHLIEAVRLGGGDPGRMLMVGDSETDLETGRRAGAPVVLVSFGYTVTPPRELGADAVIDRYAELFPIAERLLAQSLIQRSGDSA